jgi:aldose 1-epimerase
MQYAFRAKQRSGGRGDSGARRKALIAPLAIAVAGAVFAIGGVASARSHHRHSGQHRGGGLSITSAPWGTADGKAVNLYTLTNGNHMKVTISNYGGVVQSIWVPDRHHHMADVVLGFPSLSDYVNDFENQPWPAAGGSGDTYFGAIVGRYANRIAGAQFTLNGTKYPLGSGPPCPTTATPNNGPNLLHGGPGSYNTQVWDATTSQSSSAVSLHLAYTDPDCKNGFPGTVTNGVVYSLTNNNQLQIRYTATTDKATVINLTNHSYFNLAGEGSGDVFGQLLRINANTYTPVDQNLIPTGQIAPVAGTPLDFTHLKAIGQDIHDNFSQLTIAHGYDFNWVLNGSGLRKAAFAIDPKSGRTLTTYTDQPGVQFYSSNFLVGDLVGPSGHTYRQTDGFTLETQHFPDSPNEPSFPSTTLNPGQTFNSTTIYQFGVAGGHR